LKSKILRLLKEDEEFRYAVAGLIGLEEILKRLDKHDEKFSAILERLDEHSRRFEEHDKKFNEILKRLDEHSRRFEEHDRKFNEILERLDEHSRRFEEHDKKFNEIVARLGEHDRKFNEIVARLSEHDEKFNEIVAEIRDVRRELREIRTYMERASLTLEEEAWEVLSSKLRRMGIDVELSRLTLPDLEVNIYGAKGDLCVVGEASIRAGVGMVKSTDEKVEKLKRKHPEYLRKRMIKVIYTMWATDDAVEEAKKRKIWLVRALEELTTPTIQSVY